MRISRVPIVARMQIVMASPLIRRSLFSSNRSPQTIELGQPYCTDQIFDPFDSPPSAAFVEFRYTRARAHTHTYTEVRCRCSFESFRDNSSRQINLFSPRSNLFSLRETCFYISKSRGSWRSIRRWKSSCHAGNVYIYIFPSELRGYRDFLFVSSLISAITRFSPPLPLPLLRCSSLPLSSRNTRAPEEK